jgi:hypothetical protein
VRHIVLDMDSSEEPDRLAGTLALAYQLGTYQPRSYTLLSAADGVTGHFQT